MLDEQFVRQMPKLGFGLMRLPRVVDSDVIDVEQTTTMANMFFDAGLKYLDSAYVYEGSEEAARNAITSRHEQMRKIKSMFLWKEKEWITLISIFYIH